MADDALTRYQAAMHAVQTGIAYVMEKDPKETQPKHLRVGVNSALISIGAVAKVLMAKGVITPEEYQQALAELAEAEAADYTKLVNDLYGGDGRITLG